MPLNLRWNLRWKTIWPWLSLALAGTLMGCAPVYLWPLGWVAMVPLWMLVQGTLVRSARWSLRQYLLGALLWGLAYHGVALSWVMGIHPMTWLGIPWAQSLVVAVGAWIFISLWGAAIVVSWAALLRFLQERLDLSLAQRILLGSAIWCVVERIWNSGPLFWTPLGLTQSPGNLAILQWGQLGGPAAVSAALVAVNGLLAAGIASRFRSKYWLSAIALFCLLHIPGHIASSQPVEVPASESITIGLIQGNLPTAQKMTSEGIRSSYEIYLEDYEALSAAGADIVLTPEGAIPQRWNAARADQNAFVSAVKAQGVPLVLGSFSYRDIADSQTPLMQTLLSLTPDGEVSDRYAKVKLVPLGEYMPFPQLLGGLSPFGSNMISGDWQQQFETPVGILGVGICFDSAFANLFRVQVRRGAIALITASNNDPYSRWQMMQHHALDVMHAIETDRWMVRVTNTGISGVVDPKGHTQWLAEKGERTTHLAQIEPRNSKTLYVRWGDWLPIAMLVLCFGWYLARRSTQLVKENLKQ